MAIGISPGPVHFYNVATPVYEGPLDLLLQLIERAELGITMLALAQVTDQYLEVRLAGRLQPGLAMKPRQVAALQAEFPEFAGRIYLSSALDDKKLGVNDPIGGILMDFEVTAQELEQIFAAGLERIRYLAGCTAAKRP